MKREDECGGEGSFAGAGDGGGERFRVWWLTMIQMMEWQWFGGAFTA